MDKLLIYEYENCLLGNQNGISVQNFTEQKNAEKAAISILRFCIEKILRWSQDEMAKRFDAKVVEKMKLKDVLKYISLPPELDPKQDYYYYVYVLYPEITPFNFRESVINLYKRILANCAGEITPEDTYESIELKKRLAIDPYYIREKKSGHALTRFPKEYMDETDGRCRAGICLQYMLSNFCAFHNIADMYRYFADPIKGMALLRQYKLHTICKDIYDSPLDYLHEALPRFQKNDFLYTYFNYLYMIEPGWYKKYHLD